MTDRPILAVHGKRQSVRHYEINLPSRFSQPKGLPPMNRNTWIIIIVAVIVIIGLI